MTNLSAIFNNITSDSVRGFTHVRMEMPNQDAYRVAEQNGRVLVAVADGAGSHEFSELGANTAVDAAVSRFEKIAEEVSVVDSARMCFDAAREAVMSLPDPARSGSTLVLFVADSDYWSVCSVGDSFAVIEDNEGLLKTIIAPAVSEIANITEFITKPDATIREDSGKIAEVSSVAVCSDAFSSTLQYDDAPVAGFWTKIFSMARRGALNVADLVGFMVSEGRTGDDATLVVLSRD